MFYELKIPFIYTLETSFCGSNNRNGNEKENHFSVGDLFEIGKDVLKSLQSFAKV
jgi:hypothetical protein